MTEDKDSNSISQATITSYGTLKTLSNNTIINNGDYESDQSHEENDNYCSSESSRIGKQNILEEEQSSEGKHNNDHDILEASNSDSGNRSESNDGNDNGGNNVPSTNADINQAPLNIKELSLNFDYLVYKVNDRIKTLSEKAQLSTTRFKENTEITILEIDKVIQNYYEIIKKLDEINNDFSKIEQLSMIIEEFAPRIKELEMFFSEE